MNFLRKHQCQVPFEHYRSAHQDATPEDRFRAALIVDKTARALDDVILLSDALGEIPIARH